jgi:hypothetical protein
LEWFPSMWREYQQLRHAALCCFRFLQNGERKDVLEVKRELGLLGYDGMVASMSSDDVVDGWGKAGWITISPNGFEFRVSDAGREQFAQWKDEDSLWMQGASQNIQLAKRLKAGEPATNLRKIAQVIGNAVLTSVHDPYTTEDSLQTLLKLKGLGISIALDLRLLTIPKSAKVSAAISSYLRDLNTEVSARWELRAYTASAAKPHRRFMIFQDKTIITCGLSLNNIDKDEVLDRIPAGELADYDRSFFDSCWSSGVPV